MLVIPEPLLAARNRELVAFFQDNRIPAMMAWSEDVTEAGGLLAYGPSIFDMFRRGASYVSRILHGAKPADLPIEQPATYELVVNLKAAKAIGITLPQSILVRAEKVVE